MKGKKRKKKEKEKRKEEEKKKEKEEKKEEEGDFDVLNQYCHQKILSGTGKISLLGRTRVTTRTRLNLR